MLRGKNEMREKMKLKHLLLLAFLASAAFSAFGSSRVIVERGWLISGTEGEELDFHGALVLNNSHQRVVYAAVAPGAWLEEDGDAIAIRYKGKLNGTSMLVNGTAVVDVDYGTDIRSDPPLPEAVRNFTALTLPDAGMRAHARSLAVQNSSLETIRNLAQWVHSSLKYDVTYWGEAKPAQEVFRERRGVCVEYTHLLISLAGSLGFDTRYVSGYAYTDAWQPHAWAEIAVPGYGWLPADATFGQVGTLDGTHLAIVRGDDQASVYDVLLSDNGATLVARDNITTSFASNDSRGVGVTLYADNYTCVVTIDVANRRQEYAFGTYSFLPASNYAPAEERIMLLKPGETVRKRYLLNRSLFTEGYTYTLPISASFNDARDEEDVVVSTPAAGGQLPCAAAALLLLAPAVLAAAAMLNAPAEEKPLRPGRRNASE
jgi:hypothetical protein